MYSNEQVSKFLDRISAETRQKWIILVVNSPKSPKARKSSFSPPV